MSSEFYWLSIHFSVCGVGFPLHPQRCQALVTKEPTQIKKYFRQRFLCVKRRCYAWKVFSQH